MTSLWQKAVAATIVALVAAAGQAQPPAPPIPLPYPNEIMPAPSIPTVAEFANSFCPAPGKYEVTLLHPKTCCPVTVCFCLPCKDACKVTANKHVLRFSYKGRDVVIRFKHDGSVSVRDA